MTKISIIIPTYNSERYLARCLQSIARQDYPQTEVIVVDGQSSDGTATVVRRFDKLVTRFISEPDRGQSDAVTKGLQLATGDILHWHASDDVVAPSAFHRIAEEFDRHPEIDLVFSDGWAFDEKHLYTTGPCRGLDFWDMLLFSGRFQSDSAYWRSSITSAGLPLDDSMALTCDEDFFLRIWAGHKAKRVKQQLGAFCIRPGQLSQSLSTADVGAQRRASRVKVCSKLGITAARLPYLRVIHFPHFALSMSARALERGMRRVWRVLTGDVARRNLELSFFEDWLGS
jgi:glycosyltransferase involved in cell wall biosynthesis